MQLIKNLARKILQSELADLRKDLESAENRNAELSKELSGIESKHDSEIFSLKQEKESAERKAQELEKENEVLRKYYDLDEEPSYEIKMKIHIDLEINRLKEENMSLKCMFLSFSRQPMYIPQPYPVYPPLGRGFI